MMLSERSQTPKTTSGGIPFTQSVQNRQTPKITKSGCRRLGEVVTESGRRGTFFGCRGECLPPVVTVAQLHKYTKKKKKPMHFLKAVSICICHYMFVSSLSMLFFEYCNTTCVILFSLPRCRLRKPDPQSSFPPRNNHPFLKKNKGI